MINSSWNGGAASECSLVSLTDYTQPTSPIIHLTSLWRLGGFSCWTALACFSACRSIRCTQTGVAKCTRARLLGRERLHACLVGGAVRQLTRCANDHLAAESHNVLQHGTGLYCLCCHGDILSSPIKCWYRLIVLASPGLFIFTYITDTQTHTFKSVLFSFFYTYTHTHTHTHTHYKAFIACGFFFFMAGFYRRSLGPISSCRSPLS